MMSKIKRFFFGLMLTFEPYRQKSILPPNSVVKIIDKNYKVGKRFDGANNIKFNRTTMK